MQQSVKISDKITIGADHPIALIAGPCVIESQQMIMDTAATVKKICQSLNIPYIFKTSYIKANRLSGDSYQGPGIENGLKMLRELKEQLQLPILVDIHQPSEAPVVAEIANILQIPAFLCRQTELLEAAADTGRAVNIKKGQFLAPGDMVHAVEKVRKRGNQRIMVTERGTHFGHRDLIVDMRGLLELQATGCPVVFDATHSVQIPGGEGGATGGNRQYVPLLSKAALATGCIDALFLEVHPNPSQAKSDAATQWQLNQLETLLTELQPFLRQ